MFEFFAKPVSLAKAASLLCSIAGDFDQAVGYTCFGDLFWRCKKTGEFAIFLATTLEVNDIGETAEAGFREILANPEVVRTLLRPSDVKTLTKRLGALGKNEVFFPVPIPVLGGSGKLATYDKGGLSEFISIVAHSR